MSLSVFWFRRDLRIEDNAGLYSALKEQGENVRPIFIFDTEILSQVKDHKDARVAFIHQTVADLKAQFQKFNSDLWVFHGKPQKIFGELFEKHRIKAVYCNHDYEPQAIKRDEQIAKLCKSSEAEFKTFKDQVIFEKDEILSRQQTPYTVYTPYKKKWLASLSSFYLKPYPTEKYLKALHKTQSPKKLLSLKELGFEKPHEIQIPKAELKKDLFRKYTEQRDFPALDATSHLGIHLRFGTMSIRKLVQEARTLNATWLSELIWREFFMQILFHFPHVEKASFRP
ncbi:MAG: deoxyribodipyrimidine photo-lyase, partial [Pseudobdellovibrionaceae bacterium]